ncbi:MAG: hypothetical protein HEP71_07870 [Roseivirga sp.]|nr:hypothetical protein [Roseivirga sp.]
MNHIIKKQTLEIDMPPGSDVWHIQNSFKEIFNRDLLPRLEKVCDELGFDNGVGLRLDKLTIDVGTISSTELTSIWAEEVENVFRQELLSHKRARFNDEQIENLSTVEQSELSTFMYFLEKGALPWWVSDDFELTLEQLFKKLLTEQPSELVRKIRAVKNKTSLVDRLLYQFEANQLRKLLQHFEEPKTIANLRLVKGILEKGSNKLSEELEISFFFTEMATTINPTQDKDDPKKPFELLFSHIREYSEGSGKTALSLIHKQLTDNKKELNLSKSLEEAKVIQAAINVISSISSSTKSETEIAAERTVSKTEGKSDQHSYGISTETKDKTSESASKFFEPLDRKKEKGGVIDKTALNKSHLFKSLEDDGNEDSTADSKTSETIGQSHSTEHQKPRIANSESASGERELLSDQDKRAWEHIERIKRQQLAKLEQGQGSRHSTPSPKPDKSVNSKDGNSLTQSSGSEANTPSTSLGQSDLNPEKARIGFTKDKMSEGNQAVSENTRSEKNKEAEGDSKPDHKAFLNEKTDKRQGNTSEFPGSIRKPDQNSLKYWQEELESIDECYVQNAGLILLWPYLGQFLQAMGLVTDGNFISEKEQKQATLVLQYLLKPEPELDEYKLPLNKLLCGLPISEPVGKSINLSTEELDKCKKLLEATIHNWSALRGTSVEGFQSSFLLRKGVLKRHDSHWLLQVEKMPFDMLMDQLPWPISIVRLSWMNKPIYVEW